MSAELAILTKAKNNSGQTTVIFKEDFDPEVMVDISGKFFNGESTLSNPDPFNDGSGLALYKFENNVLDESGNYNGTPVGAVTYEDGKFDRAVIFNSNIYADIPLTRAQTGNIITISTWFKSSVSDYECLLTIDGSRQIFWNSVNRNLTIRQDTATLEFESSLNYRDDSWHNIVAIFNSNELIMYVDKALIGSSIGTTIFTDNGSRLGGFPTLTGQYNFNGSMDQTRIFNKVLNQEEINSLYNEFSIGPVVNSNDLYKIIIPKIAFANGSLIAKWLLDGNALDLLGTYNGTVTGSPNVVTGVHDQAYEFTSTIGEYLNMGQSISAFQNPSHTISGWVKIDGANTSAFQTVWSNNLFFGGPGSANNSGYELQYNGSTKKLFTLHAMTNNESLTDSNGNSYSDYMARALTTVVPLDTFIFVTCVMDKNISKIYIDGVFNVSVESVQDIQFRNQFFTIGAVRDTSFGVYNEFSGVVDQVSFYSKALTDAEVSELFARES